MLDSPPTSPGPLRRNPAPPSSFLRGNRLLLGIAIHGACVFVTCLALPLVLGSNIWPIAGAFWCIMALPVAVGTGSFTGWLVTRRSPAEVIPILLFTGIALSVLVGIVIVNTP